MPCDGCFTLVCDAFEKELEMAGTSVKECAAQTYHLDAFLGPALFLQVLARVGDTSF